MDKHKKHRPKGKGHKSGFMDLKRGIWFAEMRAQREWAKRARRTDLSPGLGDAEQGGAP